MPASRASVLEYKPATNLRPGESGVRLKDDPYYGKVDIGPKTDDDTKDREYEKKEKARISTLPAGERADAEEKLGRELAKRKAKSGKPSPTPYDKDDPHAMPTEASLADLRVHLGYLEQAIEDGVHHLDGEEQTHVEVLTGKRLQQRAPSGDAQPREPEILPPGETGHPVIPTGAPLEPAERDRDKTRAAKPGESAKGFEEEAAERENRERADKARENREKDKK